MITIELIYQNTDANNGMIDVIGKLISDFDSNFIFRFDFMLVCSSKSLDIWNRFSAGTKRRLLN
jgi:hypothetical protein